MSKIKRTHNHRQSKTQEIFYKIVIVCEDSVNSVAYFNAMLQELDIWQLKIAFVDGTLDQFQVLFIIMLLQNIAIFIH